MEHWQASNGFMIVCWVGQRGKWLFCTWKTPLPLFPLGPLALADGSDYISWQRALGCLSSQVPKSRLGWEVEGEAK